MSYPGNYLPASGPPRSGTPAGFVNEQMRELLKPKDGKAWTEGRRTWGQPHRGPDLQWLGDKHALHEGDSHGDEPLEGAGPPIVQAVEHGEEGCHPACDYHQEPAHQDTPPGQASRELACLQETAGEGGCNQCGPIWAQVQLLLHLHQLCDLVKLLDPSEPQFSPLSCSVFCLIYIHVCYWGHLYSMLAKSQSPYRLLYTDGKPRRLVLYNCFYYENSPLYKNQWVDGTLINYFQQPLLPCHLFHLFPHFPPEIFKNKFHT